MMNMRKNKKIYWLLLIVAAIFVGIYGFSFARYVSDSVWNYYLKSKGFYFSSDNLDEETTKHINNLWDGGSIHFNVKNNLNQSVITDYDISYNVTCTILGDAAEHAECHLNGTKSNSQDGVLTSSQICVNNTGNNVDVSSLNKTDCELGGYNWVEQIATNDLYFDIVVTDENYTLSDITVSIKATSTAPYSKTLKGDFILHKIDVNNDQIIMNYKNYDGYDRLNVTNTYNSPKCAWVSWDANKLRIDNKNANISSYETDSNGYINKIIFSISAQNSVSYIFYKTDFSKTYNVTEFLLIEMDEC